MEMLIHTPREIAFILRNRLILAKIPYRDIKVDVIGVDWKDHQTVLKIIEELQRQNRKNQGYERITQRDSA